MPVDYGWQWFGWGGEVGEGPVNRHNIALFLSRCLDIFATRQLEI